MIAESLNSFVRSLQAHIQNTSDFLENSDLRQAIIASLGRQIACLNPTSIVLIDNGGKTIARAIDKVWSVYSGDASMLYDFNRITLRISTPENAQDVSSVILKKSDGFDTGWKLRNAGKITRQIIFPITCSGKTYATEIMFEMLPPPEFPEYHEVKRMIYECRRPLAIGDMEKLKAIFGEIHNVIDTINTRGLNIEKIPLVGTHEGGYADCLNRQSRVIHEVLMRYASPEWQSLHNDLEQMNMRNVGLL